MNRPLTPRATPPSDEDIHYGRCFVICLNPMVDLDVQNSRVIVYQPGPFRIDKGALHSAVYWREESEMKRQLIASAILLVACLSATSAFCDTRKGEKIDGKKEFE